MNIKISKVDIKSGFLSGTEVKRPPANAGDEGSIPGSGRSPGEGNGNPLQYSGKPHGQRSLAGYSPWDRSNNNNKNKTPAILRSNFYLAYEPWFKLHWFKLLDSSDSSYTDANGDY